LTAKLDRLSDVEQQLFAAQQQVIATRKEQVSLQIQLDEASEIIMKLQEDVYTSKRKSLELLTELK